MRYASLHVKEEGDRPGWWSGGGYIGFCRGILGGDLRVL